jgi:hypothetical protein
VPTPSRQPTAASNSDNALNQGPYHVEGLPHQDLMIKIISSCQKQTTRPYDRDLPPWREESYRFQALSQYTGKSMTGNNDTRVTTTRQSKFDFVGSCLRVLCLRVLQCDDQADKLETVAPSLIIKRLKAALQNRPGRNGNHVGKFLEQKMALFGSLHSQWPFLTLCCFTFLFICLVYCSTRWFC